MSKQKNPAIKLFGKTISFSPNIDMLVRHHHERQSSSSASTENKSTSGENFMASIQESDPINPTEEDSVDRETSSTATESLKTPAANSDRLSNNDTIREEQTESNDSIEMMAKKPEKILPCPRCSSMDTKFCYYNNYNVKQPRHFCKNCQRFWTSGGTMRYMAVGSGRRKNKGNCPSNPDLAKHPELFPSAEGCGPRITYFPGNQPSHWNVVHFDSPASQDPTFPSSFAVNFYPANSHCISAVPGAWRTAPLPSSTSQSIARQDPASSLRKHPRNGSLLQSDNTVVESGAQRYVMPNKAFKIDDINDATTRSIRSSMGIKESNEGSFMGSNHFKEFYPIHLGKAHRADNSVILQANPAAFSRSMNFHELC